MTFAPNANWTARAEARNQNPVYFLVMEGVSFRLSTGKVLGETVTYKRLLRTPRGTSMKLDPRKGTFTIGSLSLDLVDTDGDITDLLTPGQIVPTWQNLEVQLFSGFDDLDESDFAQIFDGQVQDWKEKNAVYTLSIRNLNRNTLDEIMTNATEDTPTFLKGNPIDIYFAISTGDFSNVTFPVTFGGATPTGLDTDISKIDTAFLINERDTFLFDWLMQFVFKEPEKGKDFLEQEIFSLLGFPVIRNDGKISTKLYHPPNPSDPEVELTEDDIIGTPTLSPAFKDHITTLRIFGDSDPDADPEFKLLYERIETADITATKEDVIFDFESRGLRTSLKGVRNARLAGNKIMQRYLDPIHVVEIETHFSKRTFELGEVISVTHRNLFNPETATRGWTKVRVEIIRARPDFVRGRMRFTVLATGLNRRYRTIAPNGTADYASQTQTEKDTVLSIADTATELLDGVDKAQQII